MMAFVPKKSSKMVSQLLTRGLYIADEIQKHQVVLICCAIHSLQLDSLHLLTVMLALQTRPNRLQLLKVSNDHSKRLVRLLPDTGEKTLEFCISILTTVVAQNEIYTPKS